MRTLATRAEDFTSGTIPISYYDVAFDADQVANAQPVLICKK